LKKKKQTEGWSTSGLVTGGKKISEEQARRAFSKIAAKERQRTKKYERLTK